jgi:hypothetical protein
VTLSIRERSESRPHLRPGRPRSVKRSYFPRRIRCCMQEFVAKGVCVRSFCATNPKHRCQPETFELS